MRRDSGKSADAVSVSTSSLQSALELLATEQEALPARHRRELLLELLQDLNVGLLFLTVILGGVTIFWDFIWGLSLLSGAVVFFLFLALLPGSDLSEATGKVKKAIEETDFAKIADVLWKRRMESLVVGVAMLIAVAAGIFGFWVLLDGLISDGSVAVSAVGLMGIATGVFWSVVAINAYREYRYYTLVAAARDRLDGRLSQAASANQDEVQVSRTELDVLSQAEVHRTARTVKAAVDEGDKVEAAWGVALTPSARSSLDRLAQEQPDAWTRVVGAIHSLQDEPRPPHARSAEDRDDVVEIDAGSCAVDYRLEDDAHRVYVISVEGEAGRANDA